MQALSGGADFQPLLQGCNFDSVLFFFFFLHDDLVLSTLRLSCKNSSNMKVTKEHKGRPSHLSVVYFVSCVVKSLFAAESHLKTISGKGKK